LKKENVTFLRKGKKVTKGKGKRKIFFLLGFFEKKDWYGVRPLQLEEHVAFHSVWPLRK